MIAIILFVFFCFLESTFPNSSNNATLVVEIGVGIIIAVIVYGLTLKSEKNINNTLDEIKLIVLEQQNRERK